LELGSWDLTVTIGLKDKAIAIRAGTIRSLIIASYLKKFFREGLEIYQINS
jgi:hypothetical protein